MPKFSQRAPQILAEFNQSLDAALQLTSAPSRLQEAMAYSVLAGGKRIRPLLTYATGELFGADRANLHAAAIAVELIHCYSLIHDDLPAMDNDDLRRGRPTLHKAFDEATAILAGDALQSLAFEVLLRPQTKWQTPEFAIKAAYLLSRASGATGMVGGQMLDIAAEGQNPQQHEVEHMFQLKTGALIHVSVQLGLCCCTDLQSLDWQNMNTFGAAIGQTFQIQDDILDVTATTEELGKPQGSDEERDKPNYALRFGVAFAQQRAQELFQQAMAALDEYGDAAEPLRWMAGYITKRRN